MSLLELPKRYHPDFSQPKRKAVGPIEVDWNNPLSNGLLSCFVFDGSNLHDLTGRLGTTFVPGVVTIDQRHAQSDRFTGIEASSGGAARPHFLLGDKLYDGIEAVSFAFSTIKPSTRVYDLYDGGTRDGITMASTASVIISDVTGGSRLSWRVPHTSSDKPSHYCFTRQPSAAGPNYGTSTYRDGVDVTATQTMVFTTLGASAATSQSNGILLDSTASTGEGFYGYLYVYDRELSHAEANALAKDPYQILKPANAPVYFVPSAAGGSYTLTAESGTYATTGTAATLTVAGPGAYTLSAESGSYAVTGTDANLEYNRNLVAASGSYSLTGTDVTLTYTPATGYLLTAESGSYSTVGTDTTLKRSRIMPVDSGNYTLLGRNVNLIVDELSTPDCYQWSTSVINDTEWFSSPIDVDNYYWSTINNDVEYVQSFIDDSVIYLKSELCGCP